MSTSAAPRILALVDRLIGGEEALLELARRRLAPAGLGAELYPADGAGLDALLPYVPQRRGGVAVHLPRTLDALDGRDRDFVLELAQRFRGRVDLFVLHDQSAALEAPAAYRDALSALARELEAVREGPMLHLEYAAMLPPEEYLALLDELAPLPRIGACLDVGHIGVYHLVDELARRRPELDVFGLSPYEPELPGQIDAIQQAVRGALPLLLEVVRHTAAWGKPLHLHLHDGHPLWLGPFMTIDHMSFLDRLPLPFEHAGRRSVAPMYGPEGLREIVAAARTAAPALSLTLEIHPPWGRLRPLAGEAGLLPGGSDPGPAQRMSHWLAVLLANCSLLRECLEGTAAEA